MIFEEDPTLVARSDDLGAALEKIRGFGGLASRERRQSEKSPTSATEDAMASLAAPVIDIAFVDKKLHPDDPLNRITTRCSALPHEEQLAVATQYVLAEARAVHLVLATPGGVAVLAAVKKSQCTEIWAQGIQLLRIGLLKLDRVHEAAQITRLLDEHAVPRLDRFELLEKVRLIAGTRECPAGADAGWLKVWRADYAEVTRLRGKLIEHNIRYVRWVVAQCRVKHIDQRELLLAGIRGLLRAIAAFDPYRGLRLGTYAKRWIEVSVDRLRHAYWPVLRSPNHIHWQRGRLMRARLELWEELEREPSIVELAERVRIEPEKVERLIATLQLSASPDHLRTPRGEPVGDVLIDEFWPTPTQAGARHELGQLLCEALARLSDRERHILERRFGLFGNIEATLQEIGDEHGFTRERARQIAEQALEKIRKRHRQTIAVLLPGWFDQVPVTKPTITTAPSSSEEAGNLR